MKPFRIKANVKSDEKPRIQERVEVTSSSTLDRILERIRQESEERQKKNEIREREAKQQAEEKIEKMETTSFPKIGQLEYTGYVDSGTVWNTATEYVQYYGGINNYYKPITTKYKYYPPEDMLEKSE